MKAIVIHQYGGPEVLKFEERANPVTGASEVLVRVAAASINPIDYKRRSGALKQMFPIQFPGVLGADLSGTVVQVGSGVAGFSVGDRVMGMANETYAELCAVPATNLAKIPDGMDTVDAAALPLVTTTGEQLVSKGTGIKAGQTVLVTGAIGGVGRSAVFAAKSRGATVMAAVFKRQVDAARGLGADQVVASDDDSAMAELPPLDAVVDVVGGKTAEKLISSVKQGGVFATAVAPPENAKQYPNVRIAQISANPDAKVVLSMAQAVREGRLVIPIHIKLPLNQAAEGHTAAEKGGIGKVLLLA